MKVDVIGGGPGGLYFALLAKKAWPRWDITVYERNRPDDTFGFGVVFSDATLENLRNADPKSFDQITQGFWHWDDIDTFFKGERLRSTGRVAHLHDLARAQRRPAGKRSLTTEANRRSGAPSLGRRATAPRIVDEEQARLAELPVTGIYRKGIHREDILALGPDLIFSMSKDPRLDDDVAVVPAALGCARRRGDGTPPPPAPAPTTPPRRPNCRSMSGRRR